ncbi:PASTA domain-containing protein [Mycobacterium hubeiense]|uniref:PASTA domain-containing protein n=1 Tax=Mycobacterium hubeiense TaxID=1867256 RepID=UPI000C7F065A|nr:PASTA domain-containing protein [Mycobacterium sp. QGD 101]
MKKLIVYSGGALAAVSLALLGSGIAAAAPDVVGMTYSDAVSAIEEEGGTAKIVVTVGDRQDAMGDCLVTGATDAPFVRDDGGSFAHADGEVLLTLNCNRGAATHKTPGLSMGSQAGREFQARAEELAEQQAAEQQAAAEEEEELAEAATPGA